MKNKRLFSILIFIFAMSYSLLRGQEIKEIQSIEDSLQNHFAALINAKFDSERTIINARIVELFDQVLSNRESFDYQFDNLENISKLKASDGQVRIINWNLPKENGEYLYYAYIQYLDIKSEKLKLFKLQDRSDKLEEPEFKELDMDNWFGALYYFIVAVQSGEKTFYTLLGWDGNNNFTNRKIVECFYIKGDKLVLGPAVFKMEKGLQNRLIFEFAKQAKMMLRYDDKLEMIVWDHLAPSHKKFEGQFMYYGPDLSQDGIKFTDGYWLLKPNLDLRNMEESTGKSIKKSY
ncbi:MAG: hypothetical protein P1P88_15405 [Bacteroidales bacterium]|nr:hypothetical protein [Bacteroidales bacterium]